MGQDIAIRAEIVIRLMSDGRIGMKAPMEEPMLCYGLLGSAQQMVAKHQLMQELAKDRGPTIVPATMVPPSGLAEPPR